MQVSKSLMIWLEKNCGPICFAKNGRCSMVAFRILQFLSLLSSWSAGMIEFSRLSTPITWKLPKYQKNSLKFRSPYSNHPVSLVNWSWPPNPDPLKGWKTQAKSILPSFACLSLGPQLTKSWPKQLNSLNKLRKLVRISFEPRTKDWESKSRVLKQGAIFPMMSSGSNNLHTLSILEAAMVLSCGTRSKIKNQWKAQRFN